MSFIQQEEEIQKSDLLFAQALLKWHTTMCISNSGLGANLNRFPFV